MRLSLPQIVKMAGTSVLPDGTALSINLQPVKQQFRRLKAQIVAGWNIEHKPNGSHADVTADSVTAESTDAAPLVVNSTHDNGGYLDVQLDGASKTRLGSRKRITAGTGLANDTLLYAEHDLYFRAVGGQTYFPDVYADTNPVAADVTIASDGRLQRATSSRKHKTHICTLTGGLALLQRLRPVTFRAKRQGTEHMGFIAEEVAVIDPRLVTFDHEGQPDGVQDAKITAPLVQAIQELAARVAALEGRNA